jgi:large subunit ribosomal protein L22
MEAVAYIKYLRVSEKKLKSLSRLLIKLPVSEAIDRLLIGGTKSAKILADAIKSASSNAKNNLKLDNANLKIKTIEVLKGPIFKRWQPVSRGMAHQIKKRTTHIKVILEEVKASGKKELPGSPVPAKSGLGK